MPWDIPNDMEKYLEASRLVDLRSSTVRRKRGLPLCFTGDGPHEVEGSDNEQPPAHQSTRIVGYFKAGVNEDSTNLICLKQSEFVMFNRVLRSPWYSD
jgi:hypothetical protein